MIFTKLINYLYGTSCMECTDVCSCENVLNLMMNFNIEYFSLRRTECGGISFHILTLNKKRLLSAAENCGYILRSCGDYGLPRLIYNYRHRPGIAVGLLIFMFILQISTYFIWDMEINCPPEFDDKLLLSELEEMGCGVGTFIPYYDFHELSNDFILKHDDVSWISVNVSGTHAKVEIREKIPVPQITDTSRPSNLVASRDGYIEYFSVYSGIPEVRVGETVRKGDLLASGIIDVKTGECRIVRSIGEFYAVTYHELSAEIPYNYTEKAYTGRSVTRKCMNIFGKSIKLYINDGILFESYDKIQSENVLVLFGAAELPLSIVTETINECGESAMILTPEEAQAKAEKQMSELIFNELGTADIISRETTVEHTETSCIIKSLICCTENIAEEKFIT